MIEKQRIREAVAQVLDAGVQHEFKYIDKEVLNSKEFIQKIYRKNYRLFYWLPLYLEHKDDWYEVFKEQEKIKLGNAFNDFCQTAKLVKPNHKLDLDNLVGKEKAYFKAFNEFYSVQRELITSLEYISDYATFGIACGMDNTQEFNYARYELGKDNNYRDLEKIAQGALEYYNTKGH